MLNFAGTIGNVATSAEAINSNDIAQRKRPRSLNLPNNGLLMADARKMQLTAAPVCVSVNPFAFCRNSDAKLPMLEPAKSRRLNANAAAAKIIHAVHELNIRSRGGSVYT